MAKYDKIIDAALSIAKTKGLINLEMRRVCEVAGISTGNFHYHMKMRWEDFYKMIGDMAPESKAKHFKLDKRYASADERKKHIIEGALEFAEMGTYTPMDLVALAEYLGVSRSLILVRFGKKGVLEREVLKLAIKERRLIVIGQALMMQDPIVSAIDEELKREALAAFTHHALS